MKSKFRQSIEYAASQNGVDPRIIEAMVFQESGDQQYAYNPEPRYRYFWNVRKNIPFRKVSEIEISSKFPPSDFPALGGDPDQEWWAQQASHGILQVMGAVARERGFRGIYLPEINEVHLNLDIGCQHFVSLLRWAKGDVWKAVAGYNGGRGNWASQGPQQHANKVKKFYTKLSK